MLECADHEQDDETDEFEEPPIHRIVSASECLPIETFAYRSVWELAKAAPGQMRRPSMATALRNNEPRSIIRRIERSDQVTRHCAVREQDTAEWAERERLRRARQRPPHPPKQRFKMKGSRDWGSNPANSNS